MTLFQRLLIENENNDENTREILGLAKSIADNICTEFAEIESYFIDVAAGQVRLRFIEDVEDENALAWEASSMFHSTFAQEARMFHPELF